MSSEATLAVALQAAASIHHGTGADAAKVLAHAKALHSIFTEKTANSANATVVEVKAPVAPAAKPGTADNPTRTLAAPKPVAPKVAPKPVAPKPAKTEEQLAAEVLEQDAAEAASEGDVTREQIDGLIQALLAANLKTQAIGLLRKFGGQSASTLPPANYAAFYAAGADLLPLAD